MEITLLVLAFTVVMFVVGRIRADVVALCALATLLVFNILTPEEALSGFSSSVVVMMVGLFVVGGAVLQTGLAKAVSQRIMKLAGGSELNLFLLVMVTTSFIGAFVSNTGTVALMMPIVVSMATQSGTPPGKLLMPLAFAGSLGGMLTLIGTPPNLVIQESLVGAGYEPLKFFSFFPIGVIVIVLGVLVLLPLSRLFLGKEKASKNTGGKSGKTLEQLTEEYSLKQNLSRFLITEASPIQNKTVAELDVRNHFGLSILEIRNESVKPGRLIHHVKQSVARPDSVLMQGDILYVTGEKSKMSAFEKQCKLKRLDNTGFDFYDIGLAEIVLMPTANLNGTLLKNSGLRENYNINVVGIRRSGDYILRNLADEELGAGDVLLVQGSWTNIARLADADADWVVLGQPEKQAQRVTLNHKAPLAAAIMVLMIAMMVFDFIPVAPVTAVIIAGLLMVLTGCFRNVEAAYRTINWESIILIAAMMPMSIALEKTGTSAMISQSLVEVLGSIGPLALLAGIYFTTSLLTMFISNTATAVLMAPIAMSSATELGASPYAFLFAVTLGASMCFASPFSTPPNALVMKAGQYTFMDYIKVGLPLQLVIGIAMVFILPLLFPF
ncbi:MAG: SLC13 family permease [Prevotella sp.]|nr:SLC13 family permease [Prevotella sp.]